MNYNYIGHISNKGQAIKIRLLPEKQTNTNMLLVKKQTHMKHTPKVDWFLLLN